MRAGRWEYWSIIACVLVALDGAGHAFAIAVTVGDSELVPNAACDAVCRAGWVAYGHTAYGWLALSLASLIAICLLLVLARRTRHRQALG